MFSASLPDNKNLWLEAHTSLVTSFNVYSFLFLNVIVRELKLVWGGGGLSGNFRYVIENSKRMKYVGKEVACNNRGHPCSRMS